MARKPEKPFDKIISARVTLGLYVQHGDAALGGKTPQEFAAEVHECFEYLMEFRNIINGMVGFNEAPSKAVLPYLPDDVLAGEHLVRRPLGATENIGCFGSDES